MNIFSRLKLRAKLVLVLALMLLLFTIFDVIINTWHQRDLAQRQIREWTFLFGENVRVSLNTLMREGRMDIRFAMFEGMSAELSGLNDVRVIRGRKVDDVFREYFQKEALPKHEKKISAYLSDVAALEEELKESDDPDEKEELMEELGGLKEDIASIKALIKKESAPKEIDERERPKDELDHEVLLKGEPIYKFFEDSARVLIPYKVQEKGCREGSGCHKYAEVGDVLGAISMEFSLAEINRQIQKDNLQAAGISVIKLLVLTGVVFYLLTIIVIKNLDRILMAYRKLAKGELDVSLPVTGKDEIAELSEGFNRFVASIAGIVHQIQSTTDKLASSSEALSSSATGIAEGSASQASMSQQVSTASHEMSMTVDEVARHAIDSSAASENAGKIANQGGVIVRDLVSRMGQIAEVSHASSDQIAGLGKRSNEIGEIVEVINDIADQTNLLALNAAIEAARAGEQGRGFAVVADEVRKLAERTTKATKEIEKMIGGIQKEMKNSVALMDRGTTEVEAGVKLAEDAGRSLEEIIAHVGKVTEMIGQIATAGEEQSRTSGQISHDIESVASVSRETEKGAREIEEAAQGLAEIALALQEIASRFRL